MAKDVGLVASVRTEASVATTVHLATFRARPYPRPKKGGRMRYTMGPKVPFNFLSTYVGMYKLMI